MTSQQPMVPYFAVRSSCAEKNDKLGWTCGFSIELDDIVVGIRCNDEGMLSTLKGLLPVAGRDSSSLEVGWLVSFLVGRASPKKGTKNYHLVYQNWTRMCRTLDLDEALYRFQRLCLEFVINSGKPKAKLFAPGVSGRTAEGVNVAVVAPRAQLDSVRQVFASRGLEVFSYEYCVLDTEGKICTGPFHRDPAPLPVSQEPVQLDRLILLCSDEIEPRRITTGEATVKMMPECGGLASSSAHMFTLAQSLRNVAVWTLPAHSLSQNLV